MDQQRNVEGNPSLSQTGNVPQLTNNSRLLASLVIWQAEKHGFELEVDAIRDAVEQFCKFQDITATEAEIIAACAEAERFWAQGNVDASRKQAAGITSYCQQVCGGGECGAGPVCQHGIDPRTEMPATDGKSVLAKDYVRIKTGCAECDQVDSFQNGTLQQFGKRVAVTIQTFVDLPVTHSECSEEEARAYLDNVLNTASAATGNKLKFDVELGVSDDYAEALKRRDWQ